MKIHANAPLGPRGGSGWCCGSSSRLVARGGGRGRRRRADVREVGSPVTAGTGRAVCWIAHRRRTPPRRAAAHRRQEAGSHPGRRRTPHDSGRPGGHHGKGSGWDFVHVCVDDATRLAYVEVLADEQTTTRDRLPGPRDRVSTRRHGISTERVMPDNGAAYRSVLHALRLPRRYASDTSAPGRIVPAPTARQNASSARCSAAGPTARSMPPTRNAPPPLTAGCGPTTITDHTAPSATTADRPLTRAEQPS